MPDIEEYEETQPAPVPTVGAQLKFPPWATGKPEVYKDFPSIIRKWYPTGSRFICTPPPMDTDNDTVILVHSLAKAEALLLADEWKVCDDEEYEPGEFRAYRRDDENYIVTDSIGFFTRYVLATNAAKELNLLNKEDRVKLFIEILNKDAVGLSYGLTYNTDIRGIAWEAKP